VFHFRLHFASLFIQSLDCDLGGEEVPLELLNFIIEHKLELLKLLDLLFQIQNSRLFLVQSHVSLLNLILMHLNFLL